MYRPGLEIGLATPALDGREAEQGASLHDPLLRCIARVVDPGRQPGGVYTFQPGTSADPALAWEAWVEGVFRPTVLPHFMAVMEHAACSHAREISQLDRQFGAELPLCAIAPSRLGGRRLLHALAEAHGLRMVNKWVRWEHQGNMEAHFATLFAAHCAIFSFPVRQSVQAYLMREWRTAAGFGATLPQLHHFTLTLERAGVLVDELLAGSAGLVILDQAGARKAVS